MNRTRENDPPLPTALLCAGEFSRLPGPAPFRFDTHIPLIWEEIHPATDPVKERAAVDELVGAAAASPGVELLAVVPFSTLNGPQLDGTIAWLHERGVRQVRLCDLHVAQPLTTFHDPQVHLSGRWIRWTLDRAIRVARDCGVNLEIALRNEAPEEEPREDGASRPGSA